MVAMTKTLALEWAQSEIRVIAIIPGVSETQQPLKAPGLTLEKVRERGAKLPLGRVGYLSDIAVKVMMLLRKEASFVIGQSIAINSGAIMRPEIEIRLPSKNLKRSKFLTAPATNPSSKNLVAS